MPANIDRESKRLRTLADELELEADAAKQQASALRSAADALEAAPRVKARRRSSGTRRPRTAAAAE